LREEQRDPTMSLTEDIRQVAEVPTAPPSSSSAPTEATARVLLVWDAPNLDMGLGSILGGRPTAAPGAPVETQWAYAARTAEELTSLGASSSMLEFAIRERSWSGIARALVNDLEEVVARRYGVVAGILEELRRGEIVGARMSGSGSAAYALVVGEAEAEALADALDRRNHPVHVCRPSRAGCRVLP
jgi:hypothetical protein